MECLICSAQAWCINEYGDVVEREYCYDCEAWLMVAEDAHTEALISASIHEEMFGRDVSYDVDKAHLDWKDSMEKPPF